LPEIFQKFWRVKWRKKNGGKRRIDDPISARNDKKRRRRSNKVGLMQHLAADSLPSEDFVN
jgi:hypothetical protein